MIDCLVGFDLAKLSTISFQRENTPEELNLETILKINLVSPPLAMHSFNSYFPLILFELKILIFIPARRGSHV